MAANAKFAKDNHFAFPLLSDTNLEVAQAYGANGKTHARRIAALIDEHGRIAKIYDPVPKPGDFPAMVLQDLHKDEL